MRFFMFEKSVTFIFTFLLVCAPVAFAGAGGEESVPSGGISTEPTDSSDWPIAPELTDDQAVDNKTVQENAGDGGVPESFFGKTGQRSAVSSRQIYETAGYIAKDFAALGKIVDSEISSKNDYSPVDTMFINIGKESGGEPGDRFFVQHLGTRKIHHPVSGDFLGYKVTLRGVVEITKVADRFSAVKIVRGYSSIRVGDRLVAYTEKSVPEFDPDEPAEDKQIEGVIVDTKEEKLGVVSSDVVYLDVGSRDGVKEGDMFAIIDNRSSGKETGLKYGLPNLIGKLRVLTVRPDDSSAFVTESLSDIYAGKKVLYLRTR